MTSFVCCSLYSRTAQRVKGCLKQGSKHSVVVPGLLENDKLCLAIASVAYSCTVQGP